MPTSNITVLKNRADAVEYFIQDVNFETVEFIRKTLRRIFSLKVSYFGWLFILCYSQLEESFYSILFL